MGKFYLLYNNKNQDQLLTTAADDLILSQRTEYYSSGSWFSYDTKDGSNILDNEKEVKGIKFPKEPKIEEKIDYSKKKDFKWV